MTNRVYFPGLNGIRFLAAISVMYGHIEQLKAWFGVTGESFSIYRLFLPANNAVTLFFVLSGFLITYLLLVENQRSGDINVRHFYVRRILRIWPLYYFIVFLGLVGLPLLESIVGFKGFRPLYSFDTETVTRMAVYYILMLPHLGVFFRLYATGISQLWTIGIEENFYLLWPVLTRKLIKNLPALLFGIIGVKMLFVIFYNLFIAPNPDFPGWLGAIITFLNLVRIENMAVGGVGAYIIFRRPERLLKIIFHPLVEKLILLLMIGSVFLFTIGTNFWFYEAIPVLYMLFILNVSCNPRSTLKLENRFFNKFGRVAYGIYMYHVLVIYMVLMAFHYLHYEDNSVIYNIVLNIVVTVLTLGIAQLSYTYFEEHFLRLKKRFTIVASSPVATSAENESGQFPAVTGLVAETQVQSD